MTFRKYVMISMVLLCGSALLLGCSDDDPAAPAPGNEAPPAVISGLSIRMLSDSEVELSWDASTQPNLSGYNLYRHIQTEQAIGRLNSTPSTSNRYVDATISKGPVYEYLVTAVSAKGLESAYAAITISTNDRGKGGNWED